MRDFAPVELSPCILQMNIYNCDLGVILLHHMFDAFSYKDERTVSVFISEEQLLLEYVLYFHRISNEK